jgi:hypothetical protein
MLFKKIHLQRSSLPLAEAAGREKKTRNVGSSGSPVRVNSNKLFSGGGKTLCGVYFLCREEKGDHQYL